MPDGPPPTAAPGSLDRDPAGRPYACCVVGRGALSWAALFGSGGCTAVAVVGQDLSRRCNRTRTTIVDQTVQHFGSRVHIYEVWHQPDLQEFADYAMARSRPADHSDDPEPALGVPGWVRQPLDAAPDGALPQLRPGHDEEPAIPAVVVAVAATFGPAGTRLLTVKRRSLYGGSLLIIPDVVVVEHDGFMLTRTVAFGLALIGVAPEQEWAMYELPGHLWASVFVGAAEAMAEERGRLRLLPRRAVHGGAGRDPHRR